MSFFFCFGRDSISSLLRPSEGRAGREMENRVSKRDVPLSWSVLAREGRAFVRLFRSLLKGSDFVVVHLLSVLFAQILSTLEWIAETGV